MPELKVVTHSDLKACSCLSEEEHIKTNQQNILIRSLKLKKQKEKGDSSSKDVKGAGAAEGSRKRFDYYPLGLDHVGIVLIR